MLKHLWHSHVHIETGNIIKLLKETIERVLTNIEVTINVLLPNMPPCLATSNGAVKLIPSDVPQCPT